MIGSDTIKPFMIISKSKGSFSIVNPTRKGKNPKPKALQIISRGGIVLNLQGGAA